jgi:hypothetical protein
LILGTPNAKLFIRGFSYRHLIFLIIFILITLTGMDQLVFFYGTEIIVFVCIVIFLTGDRSILALNAS